MKVKMSGTTVDVRPEELAYDPKSGLAACKDHRDGLAFGCVKCLAAAMCNANVKKKQAQAVAAKDAA